MDTKAILFDKDGTLLDFEAFGVPVGTKATKQVLSPLGCRGHCARAPCVKSSAVDPGGLRDGIYPADAAAHWIYAGDLQHHR